MCAVERYAMDNIEAFLRSTEVTAATPITAVPHPPPGPLHPQEGCAPWPHPPAHTPHARWQPQNEEKKMKFLCSIRTICGSAAERNTVQELRIFCRRNELVENIMVRGGGCWRGGSGRLLSSQCWEHCMPDAIPLCCRCCWQRSRGES